MPQSGHTPPIPAPTDVLDILCRALATLTSADDADEVARRIVRLIAEAVGASECALYEDESHTGQLIAAAHWRAAPATRASAETLRDLVETGDATDGRQRVRARTPREMRSGHRDAFAGDRALTERDDGKSRLIIPLAYGDRTIGRLSIGHRDQQGFSDGQKELATMLAVPAALALHDLQASRRMTVQDRFLRSLVESSSAMSSTAGLDELLQRVAQEASEALHTSQAAVYTHDPEQDALIYRVFHVRVPAPGADDPLGTVCRFSDCPGNKAILFSDDIVVEHQSDADLPADRRRNLERWDERTVLSVPLRFHDERLGLLRLYEFEEERMFTPLELQFARGLGELAGAAIHDAQSFQREQARGLELETLLEASKAMTSSMELEDILGQLARRTATALGTPQCLIYEYDPAREVTVLRSVFNADAHSSDDETRIGAEYALADYPTDREVLLRSEVIEEHVSDPELPVDVRSSMGLSGEKSCLTVPLVFRGHSLGIMELVETRRERRFTASEIGLARALAEQAATALNNARLFRQSKDYAARLESSYLETVTALAAAMEAKDHYTAEHADMLARMAVLVGRHLGLSEAQLRDLQYASVLHDIGKIGIPGHILNKPDRLTPEEFAVMAEHTIIGERIVSRIDYLAPIGKAIRAAHERWDGRGYPDRLAGDEIPLPARILFVCDAFHAMTSRRPYRPAMRAEEALEELRRNAGAQFDPTVVEAFLEVWPRLGASEADVRPGTLN
ncbi:MAG TPA: GAF domain-containing protein [Thermoleophilia bacterium]|nr:GAF domain-containing protein [Thermoleophilia bacterium]